MSKGGDREDGEGGTGKVKMIGEKDESETGPPPQDGVVITY
jgi:hypothetical protein